MDVAAAERNLERNIVKETLRKCQERQMGKVNGEFIRFMARLYLLDPAWGISVDIMRCRANIEKLVEHLISRLERGHLPSVIALKIQFYHTCAMDGLRAGMKQNDEHVARKLLPLRYQILEIDLDLGLEDLPLFKRRIVSYSVLRTNMGNPKNEAVFTEAFYVLKSIMSDEELLEFTRKTLASKEEILEEIVHVSAGIRLFNKYTEKSGGEEIPNVPKLLQEVLYSTKCKLNILLEDVSLKTDVINETIQSCYTEDPETGIPQLLPGTLKEDMENLIDLAIAMTQLLDYLKKILWRIDDIGGSFEVDYKYIKTLTNDIAAATISKLAVPVDTVFPRFTLLAKTWMNLQNQMFEIIQLNVIASNLRRYVGKVGFRRHSLDEIARVFDETTRDTLVSVCERISVSVARKSMVDPIFFVDAQNYLEHNLCPNVEFMGYCPVKLVETKGALYRGSLEHGLAVYKNKRFIFSSPQCLDAFLQQPKKYFHQVVRLCRAKPHLVTLLRMRGCLEELRYTDLVAEQTKNVVEMSISGCQCESSYDQIVEPGWEVQYEWNVWDLKRETLQLSNLTHCQTSATQTIKSYTRTGVRCQADTSIKDTVSQTKKDNYTNVPKPSMFIYGLRGRRDDKQFKLHLTRPVNE